MIEKTVLNYLIAKNITGIGENVYMEVPSDPVKRYILIEKTGSSEENTINYAQIAVQSISRNSLLEAAELNEVVKTHMKAMPESEDVYGVKLNSDYNFTNTATKEYRYQAVFGINY